MAIRAVDASAVAHAGLLLAEMTERTFIACGDIATTWWTTLTEGAEQSAVTELISPLIDATITVIIFTITDLFRLFPTITTSVTCPLIDRAIAIIVLTIAGLGDESSRWRVDHLTRLTTLRYASSAGSDESSVTCVRWDRGGAILILVDQTITVIIDPITDLNLTVRDA